MARFVWQRHQGTGAITYSDARTAALRAVRSRQVAWLLEHDPTNPGVALARDYAQGPWINRSNANYEYQTVVQFTAGAESQDVYVVVRSKRRLSGEEVIDRAERQAGRGEGEFLNYRTQLDALGPAPQVQTFILGATHNPADR